MEFAKYHGLGNDFLVVRAGERSPGSRPLSVIARQLCERHCGAGADGVLFYQPTSGDREAEYSVLIFNSDGSKAEMSGNGIRCLAAHLHHVGEHSAGTVRLRTVSGIKTLTLLRREGFRYDFQCSMGHPILDPRLIPANLGSSPGPVLNHPLQVGSENLGVSLCSMGNPHCSTFWPDVDQAPVDSLGPEIERHPAFPNRTNVEFIQVLQPRRIRVRFWERGAGRTSSSGTGSSAAAVAAILLNRAESPLTVETELGLLYVEWDPGRELRLSGPAAYVYSATIPSVAVDA